MGAPSVGREIMARLVDRLGGADAAAERLGVSASLIRRFVDGTMDVPDAVLLKAVDLLGDSKEPPTH